MCKEPPGKTERTDFEAVGRCRRRTAAGCHGRLWSAFSCQPPSRPRQDSCQPPYGMLSIAKVSGCLHRCALGMFCNNACRLLRRYTGTASIDSMSSLSLLCSRARSTLMRQRALPRTPAKYRRRTRVRACRPSFGSPAKHKLSLVSSASYQGAPTY